MLDRPPDASAAEIGIKVDAFESRIVLAAVAVAASYGTLGNVVILGDGKRRAAVQEVITATWWIIVETVQAFEHAPAVVFSPAAGGQLEVNLFPCVLTDVGDKKVAGDPVE